MTEIRLMASGVAVMTEPLVQQGVVPFLPLSPPAFAQRISKLLVGERLGRAGLQLSLQVMESHRSGASTYGLYRGTFWQTSGPVPHIRACIHTIFSGES